MYCTGRPPEGATAILETSTLHVDQGDPVLGDGGTGTLALQEGGLLRVAGDLVVGNSGLIGSFVVESAQNGVNAGMAIAGHLRLGAGAAVAQGVFDNGGTGAAGTATIGDGGPGQLIISNAGRFVAMSNEEETQFGVLTVGNRSAGTVLVESGGELQADGIFLGAGGTGVGTLTLRNATAFATRIGITVGDGGNGATLTVEGASTVRSAANVTVGASGGKATVTLAGDAPEAPAQLMVSGRLGIGLQAAESSVTLTRNATVTAGQIVVGGLAPGRLAILDNSVVTAPTTTVTSDGLLIGAVTLPAKHQKGAETPNLVGDLIVEEGGRVRVRAGSTPGIHVSGNATFGSALEVDFADEAGLAEGNVIRLIQVDGMSTGDFAEVSFPTRSAEFDGDLSMEGGELVLAVNNPGTPLAGEGQGEGEGEGEVEGGTPGGCRFGKDFQSTNQALGDWITSLFSIVIMIGAGFTGRQSIGRSSSWRGGGGKCAKLKPDLEGGGSPAWSATGLPREESHRNFRSTPELYRRSLKASSLKFIFP